MKRLLPAILMALPLLAAGLGAQRSRPEPEPLYNANVEPTVPDYKAGPPLKGALKGICSETFPDLMKLWIDGFRKYQPGLNIEVAPTGGGVGSKALANGEVDFAAVTLEINPADEALFIKKKGYKPQEIAVRGGRLRVLRLTDRRKLA